MDGTTTNVYDCSVIELPQIADRSGNITPVMNEIPFSVKRVYYLYDVPGGEVRGGHAHRRGRDFASAGQSAAAI